MHWLLISQRDHPRLRGEHLELIGSNNINVGSPPPTRGTPEKMVLDIYSHRITPAYAGNTLVGIIHSIQYGDHPRLRGEHRSRRSGRRFNRGSPPPTRGTQRVRTVSDGSDGITPAYAGNTSMS